jgi:hypothetical protein
MAANHIVGRGELVPTATATLVVAILVVSVMLVFQLKADAQNVVKIISGDKLKIESYCAFANLSDQVDEAIEQQDTSKSTELSQKVGVAEKTGSRIYRAS